MCSEQPSSETTEAAQPLFEFFDEEYDSEDYTSPVYRPLSRALRLAGDELFASLWPVLVPHLSDDDLLDLLKVTAKDGHDDSPVAAAFARVLLDHNAHRKEMVSFFPRWRDEAAERILNDPTARPEEIFTVAKHASAETKTRAVDVLFEALEHKPERYPWTPPEYLAEIIVHSRIHRDGALRRFFAFSWNNKIETESFVDGPPTEGLVIGPKGMGALDILKRCQEASVRECVADDILGSKNIRLLGEVAGSVPSRSDAAVSAIESWCDEQIPLTRSRWSKGFEETTRLRGIVDSLDAAWSRYPDLKPRLLAIVDRHDLYHFATDDDLKNKRV